MSIQHSMIQYKSEAYQFSCVIPFGKFASQVRDGKARKKGLRCKALISYAHYFKWAVHIPPHIL